MNLRSAEDLAGFYRNPLSYFLVGDEIWVYKHGYFCTPIASRSSYAFPIFQILLYKFFNKNVYLE